MKKEEFLNKLLGDELISHLQYAIASKVVEGADYDVCKAEFETHSKEELDHFNKIMDLIIQRGYKVDSDLKSLINNAKSGYSKMNMVGSKELVDFQHKAEVNAINAYREFLGYLEKETKKDYAAIKEIKSILNDEIEHRTDLEKMFTSISSGKKIQSKFDY